MVRGGAADSEEATRILQIVRDAAAGNNWIPDGNGWGPGDDAIVNMLEVPGESVIRLDVKFGAIEQSRMATLATAAHIFGDREYNHATDDTEGFIGAFDDRATQRIVAWAREIDTSRVVAGPTLTARSGQVLKVHQPRFWTVLGASTEARNPNTQLNLTLEIGPDFHDGWITLDIVATFDGVREKTRDSRRIHTTVRLREGQSVVLSHNASETGNDGKPSRSPLFLQQLAASRPIPQQSGEAVILCIITPELIRPMDPDEVPPLPGFQVTPPNDVELYWYAKSEGYPDSPGATLPSAYSLKDDVQYFPAGPEFHLVEAAQLPRPQRDTSKSSPAASVQVRFGNPAGMTVSWAEQGRDGTQLVTPGRHNFAQGGVYRLTASNIPGRDGLSIHSTLEVYPGHSTTAAYLSHNSVPIEISNDDLKQIGNNKDVTKVVYLPDSKSQPVTAGLETLVAIDSEPGTDSDPVIIAERRGTILLVLRLGNTDEDIAAHEWTLMQRPGLIAPAGSSIEAQSTDSVTPSTLDGVVKMTGAYPDSPEPTLPSAHSLKDDVEYFPAGPEFRLTRPRFRNPAGSPRQWRGPRPGLIAPPDSATEIQQVSAETPELPEPVLNVTARMTSLVIIEEEFQVVEFQSPLKRVDGFDPEIVDVEAAGPKSVRLRALQQGVTTVVLTDADGQTWQLDVFVKGDVRHLQAIITNKYPDCAVEAFRVGDAVALLGWVSQPEHISAIVELAEQFYHRVRVLNHMHTGGVTQAQIQQTAYFPTGSFGEVFPVPNPSLPGVSPAEAVPSDVTACSSRRAPAPADDRIVHLRKAIESLQAAGLAEQVRAVEREIEKEQSAQKERQVEELQLQIQAMRRRLGVPAPIPEAPMPAATQYFR